MVKQCLTGSQPITDQRIGSLNSHNNDNDDLKKQYTGAPKENVVQNPLNMALLNVF